MAQDDIEEAVEEVLVTVDALGDSNGMSVLQYIDFLDDIIVELRTRRDAAKEGLASDEEDDEDDEDEEDEAALG